MILHPAGSSAELIARPTDESRLYLVHNEALERLLFNRNLISTEFRKTCLDCSRHYFEHLADEYAPADTAELVVLSKGLLYQLAAASQMSLGTNLPTNLIATSRVSVSHDKASVQVAYDQIEVRSRSV